MNTTEQTISQLALKIIQAKNAYYNSSAPIMSDLEYDALEDQLRQLAPNHPSLAVGSPVGAMLGAAKHSMHMGSQSKVNSEQEFSDWHKKLSAQDSRAQVIHASLKGDGASAAAYYKNGELVQVISRGDGDIGEDITQNARMFEGLPHVLKNDFGFAFTGSVRFEVMLTKKNWKIVDPLLQTNPRNVGTGIMRRKNGHQAQFLKVFAFDLIEDGREFKKESDKEFRLESLGFTVLPSELCKDTQEAVKYFRMIERDREDIAFWIDGVVLKLNDLTVQKELGITSGCPKGQIAWKFDSAGKKTILRNVTISGGHTGALIPTANFDPVEIGGTMVSNASLANFDEIARLDVAIGDEIWVVKANDIIPKITHVTERSSSRTPIATPAVCPFCGGNVGRRTTHNGDDGAVTECKNADCSKKSIGKIRRWISSLDIQGIGDVILECMVDQLDLQDASDLYTLHARKNELIQLVTHDDRGLTLGLKRANTILDNIQAKRELTLAEFLGSLGIDSLGKRRVELMINAADGALSELHQWTDSDALKDVALAEKAGVPNIGWQIQEGINAMNGVMDKMLNAGVTIKALPIKKESSGTIEKTVCISGKLNSGKKKSDYAAPLEAAGYKLVDDVAKGLSYLVLAEPDSTSSKSQKAKKLGIAVISEEQLIKICG